MNKLPYHDEHHDHRSSTQRSTIEGDYYEGRASMENSRADVVAGVLNGMVNIYHGLSLHNLTPTKQSLVGVMIGIISMGVSMLFTKSITARANMMTVLVIACGVGLGAKLMHEREVRRLSNIPFSLLRQHTLLWSLLVSLFLMMMIVRLEVRHRQDQAIRLIQEAELLMANSRQAGLPQWKDAEQRLLQAITIADDSSQAYSDLGFVLMQQGRRNEAEIAYLKAIEHQPDTPLYHYSLGILYVDMPGRMADAIDALNQAIRLDPTNAEANSTLAYAYIQLGQCSQAQQSVERGLQVNPHLATLYKNQGSVYICLKQYDQAYQAFQTAIKLDPQLTPNVMFLLSHMYEAQGKHSDACAMLKVITTTYKTSSDYIPAKRKFQELRCDTHS